MKTIYLLPFDAQQVKFSFDKKELEHSVREEKGLPNKKILEIEIDEELAEKLTNPKILNKTQIHIIPQVYYDKTRQWLNNPPDWFVKEGTRIYIIFDAQQRCFWSPSGNNLNSIKNTNSKFFLSEAIRVNIDSDTYININAYLDWKCDTF